jgi:PPP family 3-phenylpropionic acid transporter
MQDDMHSELSSQKVGLISVQYFLYFGVLGIYLPYFNLYCYHLDFSGFQIGLLSAARTVTTIIFPLLWGRIADRYRIRKPIFIVCNIISAALWILMLLTTDYRLMLMIIICYGIFYAPLISFLEAFAIDLLGSRKKDYGRLRVWGSISFIATVLVLGKIIDRLSIDIIIVLIAVGSILQALVSLSIPAGPRDAAPSVPKSQNIFSKTIKLFLFCAFLMLVSHGTYYGFFSIHLENLGFDKTFIGIAWALASVAEIIVMVKSKAIFKAFSLKNVLLFSFGMASLRWMILFWSQSALIILATQVLHAFTYGAFHMASILYVDALTPAKSKTFGQAVNNAVTYGLGMMVGFFFNGFFYEKMGSQILFLISSLIALAGGLLFSVQIKRPAAERNAIARK